MSIDPGQLLQQDLGELLASCMIADRHALRRRWESLRSGRRREDDRAGPRANPGTLQALADDIERSMARARRRRELRPVPSFPGELPVVQRREEIAATIRDHQVVVLCGETGSGKTTQLPKICLDLGLGVYGTIGHTQPRRIAARTVAARIAEELGLGLGAPGGVGYKVRFGDKTHEDTTIKLMTDGILLAETQTDRFLNQYDTLIIDEAHERSLNIDFLLGYLRQILPRRPELKVIVTSATIDPHRFADHFGDLTPGGKGPAPIIEVSGRTYPVEVRYRGLADAEDRDERDMSAEIVRAVDEIARDTSGDVLVFLPGEREIRESAEALRKHHPAQTEILPLYARLSVAEQQRVFERHGRRRIVLATNVAETSLTVPGIRGVVDTGVARISRYSAGTKVQRLPVEAISQASANQRAGRCGRVAEGICIRLYTEEDFASRPAFTDPEILRTNLASVILQMEALRLGKVQDFPFVDPPDRRLVKDGYDTLFELGAIDEEGRITELGRELARLPVDPRIGRMVLAGAHLKCLTHVLPIAAALSTQDPRDRPIEKADQADAAHAQFEDPSSDFVSLLNLWKAYQEQSRHLSWNKLRKWCHEHFVSFVRIREWESIYEQLHELVGDMGYAHHGPRPGREGPVDHEHLHRALLTGLLCNVGKKGEHGFYRGCRGTSFKIFPGSGLFGKGPGWVMAAEIVETTQMYARTCARIEPGWIEDAAQHLVKRSFGDGVWDRESGMARTPEKVVLFGLEIASGRMVPLAPHQPDAAREIFIHHALVEGDYAIEGPYRRHNRAVLDEVKKIEAKTRRPDAIADTQTRYAFFDARLPRDVVDGQSFEKWRKVKEREQPKALFMSVDDVLHRDRLDVAPEQLPAVFPDRVDIDGATLRVDYRYDPGSTTDGVTITVPIEALNQFDQQRADYLVPGLVPRKVEALLQVLPKQTKRDLGPVDALAKRATEDLVGGTGGHSEPLVSAPLEEVIAKRVRELTGVSVDARSLTQAELPAHVRLNYRIVDEQGKELAVSRDLAHLRAELGDRARTSFLKLVASPLDRDGLTDWTIGDLPETIQVSRRGATITGYPSLIDKGKSVAVRVLDSAHAAARASRGGLRRLFYLQSRGEIAAQYRVLIGIERLAMAYAALGSPDSFREQMSLLIAELAFLGPESAGPRDTIPVRTKDQFDRVLLAGTDRIPAVGAEVCKVVEQVLSAWQRLTLRLAQQPPAAWTAAIEDARRQLAALVPRDLLAVTSWDHLRHIPRYLSAIELRLGKLTHHAARDAELMRQLAPLQNAYLDTRRRCDEAGVKSENLDEFGWLIEELRVQLFAQELRTAVSVSLQKLQRQWSELKL